MMLQYMSYQKMMLQYMEKLYLETRRRTHGNEII